MAITNKETILKFNVNNVPSDLRELDQWIYWKAEYNERRKQFEKVPYKSPSVKASTTNKNTWKSFESCVKNFKADVYDGIGFVLTKEDNLVCLDIDGAVNPETFEPLTEIAKDMIKRTWYEISPSATGIHCYFKGEIPDNARKKNLDLGIELYSHGRYITFTGFNSEDVPINEDEAVLSEIVEKYFNGKPAPTNESDFQLNFDEVGTTTELTKDSILKIMAKSKVSDKIGALMRGDWEHLYTSQSEADLGLCNYLAFFCNKDYSMIDTIFKESGLYRDKWDKVHGKDTYGALTINKAIYECKSTLGDKQKSTPVVAGYVPEYVPAPYIIKDTGGLYKEVEVGTGKDKDIKIIQIASNYPFITKRIKDIETGEITYELAFMDDYEIHKRPVTSSQIKRRDEIIDLAMYGLDVFDNNRSDMLEFIHKCLMYNKLATIKGTNRIGHIKGHFVIPNEENDIHLNVTDPAQRKILDAFVSKGTLLEYNQHVFQLVKNEHVVMTMIYGSLASILLEEFEIDPFIIDTSSKTSTGKTTALKVTATVWGDGTLVNSFNSTKVAIERKTTFLNSFPILLDDSRGANPKELGAIVYNHSFATDKGRGTIQSVKVQSRHRNIMISTGETSLSDASEEKGGMSARVITLEDEPFSFKGFTELYEAIGKYHGTLGKAFWKCYLNNKEYYHKQYTLICQKYFEKGNGNEVLERMARAFGILELAGLILSQMDLFQHPYQQHMEKVYTSMLNNNKNIDKPNQLLERVLEELDGQRNNIIYDQQEYVQSQVYAIYKREYLGILPAKLRDLIPTEYNKIIREWYERGYLITDTKDEKIKTQKTTATKYKTLKTIAIKNEVIRELGFDFSQNFSNYDVNI
ncbi:DUF927 domain-containing protein [Macrococcoides bohemicum]|uniref:phage NrS-1 polymerase family protein n=1 Tax=Macrococcoides bohemicum TaxID=1903056 RepID=UPI0010595D9A|nr:DUF927 domain-containing protein [Macrococcus bohemicus]TDL37020.1 DUF927 domain-containing protein [Macrococcus bohemicus]